MASRPESHWDAAYRDRGTTGVSWYQPTVSVSLRLIHQLEVPKDSVVIDIGGGASLLTDSLVADGFSDLSVLDVSGVALDALRQRLPPEAPVTLIHADLLTWEPDRRYDLWHDRAVFHFLVETDDKKRYVDLLHLALRPGGTVVLGTFASDGPEYCSGLPVARYGPGELVDALGTDVEVLALDREDHVTPVGVIQPFTWVAARLR
jgi:hypothetical protein